MHMSSSVIYVMMIGICYHQSMTSHPTHGSSNDIHDEQDHYDPQLSFSTQDMEYFSQWGLNAMRLGFMWPGE